MVDIPTLEIEDYDPELNEEEEAVEEYQEVRTNPQNIEKLKFSTVDIKK